MCTDLPRRLLRCARWVGLPVVLLLGGCAEPAPRTDAPGLRVGDVLGADAGAAQFARADRPRRFEFPMDHAAHPRFRSEWWYLTLALADGAGREFGVQFTVFRQALFADAPTGDPWRNGQAYLGHFAVTDVRTGTHREAERLARGHPGLAGAQVVFAPDFSAPKLSLMSAGGTPEKGTAAFSDVSPRRTFAATTAPEETTAVAPAGSGAMHSSQEASEGTPTATPAANGAMHGGQDCIPDSGGSCFAVWVEGWRLNGDGDNWALEAAADDFAVALRLVSSKPVVLQGDRGLSAKGPGQASYYYSVPRLLASGRLQIGDDSHEVSGIGWLDREWSTSVLSEHQLGWDWFALMLDSGEDIMAFRLRRDDGLRDPYDHGVLVDAAGNARTLEAADFSLEPQGYWRDERGTAWPTTWTLRIRERRWQVVAPVGDQRMDTLLTYWEGLVHVLDQEGDRAGRGYMELTGYR